MGIQLEVCGITGEKKTIHLCDTEEQLNSITVLQLKEKIIEKLGYQYQPSELRLIYCGRTLDEDALLSQCEIIHRSAIHVVQKLLGGGQVLPPVTGDGGMGDKDGKNRSMETFTFF